MQEVEQRGQFTFYASIFESASRIRNKAARADFYDAICNYALNGIEPNLEALSDAGAVGFISARPNLDASRKKAKSGSKGGKGKQTESKPEANGKQNESKTKQTVSEKEKEKEREKEKENECYIGAPPEANRKQTACELPVPEEIAGTFSAFWKAYPKPIGKDMAWMAWQTINPDKETSEKIMSSLEAWKKSGQWTEDGDRFIPKPAKWLSEGYWKINPAPAKSNSKDVPKGASGELGEAELEAIQKVLTQSI